MEVSNYVIFARIPIFYRASSHLQNQMSSEKVLGIYWNTQQDVIQFETKFHRIPKGVLDGDRVPTKRELLGIVTAIFDPFGLTADYHISAKIWYKLTGMIINR